MSKFKWWLKKHRGRRWDNSNSYNALLGLRGSSSLNLLFELSPSRMIPRSAGDSPRVLQEIAVREEQTTTVNEELSGLGIYGYGELRSDAQDRQDDEAFTERTRNYEQTTPPIPARRQPTLSSDFLDFVSEHEAPALHEADAEGRYASERGNIGHRPPDSGLRIVTTTTPEQFQSQPNSRIIVEEEEVSREERNSVRDYTLRRINGEIPLEAPDVTPEELARFMEEHEIVQSYSGTPTDSYIEVKKRRATKAWEECQREAEDARLIPRAKTSSKSPVKSILNRGPSNPDGQDSAQAVHTSPRPTLRHEVRNIGHKTPELGPTSIVERLLEDEKRKKAARQKISKSIARPRQIEESPKETTEPLVYGNILLFQKELPKIPDDQPPAGHQDIPNPYAPAPARPPKQHDPFVQRGAIPLQLVNRQTELTTFNANRITSSSQDGIQQAHTGTNIVLSSGRCASSSTSSQDQRHQRGQGSIHTPPTSRRNSLMPALPLSIMPQTRPAGGPGLNLRRLSRAQRRPSLATSESAESTYSSGPSKKGVSTVVEAAGPHRRRHSRVFEGRSVVGLRLASPIEPVPKRAGAAEAAASSFSSLPLPTPNSKVDDEKPSTSKTPAFATTSDATLTSALLIATSTTPAIRPRVHFSAATTSASPPSVVSPTAPTSASSTQPYQALFKRNTKTKTSAYFLGGGIPAAGSGHHISGIMDRLQVRPQEVSHIKTKAVEDARSMQARVNEECKRTGKDPPPYGLEELIGKGSFGRVYKGKDMKSAAVVAVKIIDIDESDTINPRNADSYSEFLKEVNALKILSENKAKNINLVIEALPVNQAMWMITEYCGGGSVATLMKPTAPGGLLEKWIIPILREAAEAIKWVHQAGIIHRDIKCANVLVTEAGDVQLCDFGVAGIVESKLDKRSTIIGTPHWMAPELFASSASYGNEVDIWAFGAMVYEVATGLPPNVANGITYERLGTHLKHYTPRLEGGDYSNNLRSLVAFCLEEDPKARPSIDQVQKHPYISNTSSAYPTSTLKALVGSFKVWESRGGSRKSLFMQHGAQNAAPFSPQDDEWNFNSTEFFESNPWGQYGVKDVIEAYGPSAAVGFPEDTTRPPAKVSRRRPPPEALSRLPAAPLEKIFDPNTLSNYEDNSRVHYGGRQMSGSISSDRSDLPLRDDSAQISIRDTMIDLGGHDVETGLSSFPDMDTIKANRRGRDDIEDDHTSTLQNFSKPALSDPAEVANNRRTQDWKFPSMANPASADPELSRFPTTFEFPRPMVTPGSGGRPALMHHPTEPIGAFGGLVSGPPAVERQSMRESLIDLDMSRQSLIDLDMSRQSMRESLIDLDMSMPDPIPEFRPSTANSDVGSTTSENTTSGNPFELEKHASFYQPPISNGREPSIYVSEESSIPTRLRNGNALQELAEMSDFSASDAEGVNSRRQNGGYDDSEDSYYVPNGATITQRDQRGRMPQYDGVDDSDYLSMPPPPIPSTSQAVRPPRSDSYPIVRFPELPSHPSRASLTGSASESDMTVEITRIVAAMSAQLESFKDVYDTADVLQRRGSNVRRDRREQIE